MQFVVTQSKSVVVDAENDQMALYNAEHADWPTTCIWTAQAVSYK